MKLGEAVVIMEQVRYPEYKFALFADSFGQAAALQASYMEPDIDNPDAGPVAQYTRRWSLQSNITKDQLVQTAFKCVLTSAEHRVREHFKYKGELVFGPHFDVDQLAFLAKYTRKKHEGQEDPPVLV